MIEYVESAGEGTLLSYGVAIAIRLKLANENETVSIVESKDVPGGFALIVGDEEGIVRFRPCGPDCETGK